MATGAIAKHDNPPGFFVPCASKGVPGTLLTHAAYATDMRARPTVDAPYYMYMILALPPIGRSV